MMQTSAASHSERAVSQRFEAKYILREADALAVREFAAPHVRPDIHGQEYSVLSLYLDSPRLSLFRSSEAGEKNRVKLRIRAYGNEPAKPVFFEIKRRVDQVILKHRAAVSRDYVEDILNGGVVSKDMMVRVNDDAGMADLTRFRDAMESLAATPRVLVRYLREAYVSDREEAVRVTFDRRLSCLPCLQYDASIWSEANPWRDMHQSAVILEIKFTDAFPSWVRQLIQRLELRRDSFAKYVGCVRALWREGIRVEGDYGRETAWNF